MFPTLQPQESDANVTLFILYPQLKFITSDDIKAYWDKVSEAIHNITIPFNNIFLIGDDGVTEGETIYEKLEASLYDFYTANPTCNHSRYFNRETTEEWLKKLFKMIFKDEKRQMIVIASTLHEDVSANVLHMISNALIHIKNATLHMLDAFNKDQLMDHAITDISMTIYKYFKNISPEDLLDLLDKIQKQISVIDFNFLDPHGDYFDTIKDYLNKVQKTLSQNNWTENTFTIDDSHYPNFQIDKKELNLKRKAWQKNPIENEYNGLGIHKKWGPNYYVVMIRYHIDEGILLFQTNSDISQSNFPFYPVSTINQVDDLMYEYNSTQLWGKAILTTTGHYVGLDEKNAIQSGIVYHGVLPKAGSTRDAWDHIIVFASKCTSSYEDFKAESKRLKYNVKCELEFNHSFPDYFLSILFYKWLTEKKVRFH